MRVIGLTGSIASGKSTVAALLAERGAQIIDADRLGHRAYAPGTETFAQVVAAFGTGVVAPDGSIDRKRLGTLVFGHPDELALLMSIVGPRIRELAQAALASAAAQGVAVAVLEAAILIEAGWSTLVDEVWLLTVPPPAARQRLIERSGLSPEEADRRLTSQRSDAERLPHADLVIPTDGSLDQVRERVALAWEAFLARAPAP